jgi:hypothetical protein
MAEEKLLPKPELDLPLPEKDLPLPEKELTDGNDNEIRQSSPPPTKRPPEHEHMESIPPGQILKATPPVEPQVQPVNEGHSGRKKLFLSSFLFGIIFVIILILLGGVLVLNKQKSSSQNQQIVKTQVKPVSSSPTPIITPKKLSNSYTGDEFSFKFPEDKFVLAHEVCSNNSYGPMLMRKDLNNTNNRYSGVGCVNGIIFDVQKVDKLNASLSDSTCYSTTKKQIKIDGYVANSYTNEFIGGEIKKCTEGMTGIISETYKYIYINKDNQLYLISWPIFDNIDQNAYDQILSTFQFTDAISPAPSASAQNYCPNAKGMSYEDALEIASSSICAEEGTILSTKMCNSNGTGYWWLDFTPNTPKSGCNPACVVDVATKQAEINWRCTGLIPPKN